MEFPKDVLLLDLETTGLSREKDQIISIGITYLNEDKQQKSEYWFLEHPDEEKVLLQRFLLFVKNYEAIFTYYGRGFEFPFLLARLKHYQLDPSSFLMLKLIDMKTTLKHFASSRHELENLLGYKRQSQSTGQDIVKLYQTYLTSQLAIYKTCILSHQEEELESLLFFLELYLTLYESSRWHLHHKQFNSLFIDLEIALPASFSSTFSAQAFNLTFSYKQGESILYIKIPLFNGLLKHDLTPLKDYYYIESQGQLMHKSLIQFIPSSLRRKATKEDCVVSKEGIFVPLITSYKVTDTIWHDANHKLYIESQDFTFELLLTQLFYAFFSKSPKGGGH